MLKQIHIRRLHVAETAAMAAEALALDAAKSTVRRDKLVEIEKKVQRRWEDASIFEVEAPSPAQEQRIGEKFFGNFPYPYMNGALHLGHAFSLSKLEFMAAYKRLKGGHVLFPMGFHCTGMPIKACADKLDREIRLFGNPPVFPQNEIKIQVEAVEVAQTEPDKFKSKKSKVASKTGLEKYQWNIMRSLGIEAKEIEKFRDPYYWLTYFPPIAKEDLKALGLGCDWRRSFITTDVNPYYDSFVSWHLQKLKNKGKVVKDMRYTIYSPADGQPCADHDRASGEGAQPQEYVLIKMEVKQPFSGKLRVLEGRRVFLAAATLRPETMYGQTNAWVLPTGHYGAYEVNETDVFIVTERAARNLAYQCLSRVPEKPTSLLQLVGQDLIGVPLVSPLSKNAVIYALPMLTILADKGTGVVTSVPSDSPDDYIALMDLKTKPAFRAKFGVKDEWVLPFEVIPIIYIPEFGNASAVTVCTNMKIKSQNDTEKLVQAKKDTYLKGFTEGTMLVGEFQGMRVQDAKPLIKNMLLDTLQAVIYSEPERKVISRSDDECVVALTDQWYLTYGESEWKEKAIECLSSMELYNDEARHGFEHTLSWLNQWACSRSFGLGTKIPWDPQFLIESLSDSTIYMAYYTVAHILQGGEFSGSRDCTVKPEELTYEVWDYIFGEGKPVDTTIPQDILNRMKQEFEYWYPFDLRVSGKDLIQNHLTFSIYNHTAMFPREKWPRSFRCNGMLLLNSEKMSKSTGNFLTIRQAIEEFSADATRFALADAGDTMEDANFVVKTANAAILRLTKEITWMEEVFAAEPTLRQCSDFTFADKVFANEINIAISQTEQNYEKMLFRETLKTGYYDLQAARDEYRLSCGVLGMHRDLLWRFMDVQTRLLTPFCPHYAEHVWSEILKKEGFAVKAGWPSADNADMTLQRANKYLQSSIIDFRTILQKQMTGTKKGKKSGDSDAKVTKLNKGWIFVAEKYEGWKEECIKVLQAHYDEKSNTFSSKDKIALSLRDTSIGQMADNKQILEQCMPLIEFKKTETYIVGIKALDLTLPFNEIDVLKENIDLIQRQLGLQFVVINSVADAEAVAEASSASAIVKQSPPSPGSPVIIFSHMQEDEIPRAKELESGIYQVQMSK